MTTETKFTVGDYKTRNGRDAIVSIIRSDMKIVGAMTDEDGVWWPQMWHEDGSTSIGYKNPSDLMPPLREWWVVAGEAWDNESECRAAANLLHNRPEIIRVREVRDDQA